MSNAIDLGKICDTMWAWISSRKVVPGDQNSQIIQEDPNIDRPEPPYISYRFLTGPVKVGTTDNRRLNESTGLTEVFGPRDLTMSFKAYGEGALQRMTNLHASLELSSVQQLFQGCCIAVRDTGTPTDISQEVETGIEERAVMDLILGVTSFQSEDEGEIARVIIQDAKVKDATGADKAVVNETINKP